MMETSDQKAVTKFFTQRRRSSSRNDLADFKEPLLKERGRINDKLNVKQKDRISRSLSRSNSKKNAVIQDYFSPQKSSLDQKALCSTPGKRSNPDNKLDVTEAKKLKPTPKKDTKTDGFDSIKKFKLPKKQLDFKDYAKSKKIFVAEDKKSSKVIEKFSNDKTDGTLVGNVTLKDKCKEVKSLEKQSICSENVLKDSLDLMKSNNHSSSEEVIDDSAKSKIDEVTQVEKSTSADTKDVSEVDKTSCDCSLKKTSLSPSLVLPLKYKKLKKQFSSLDTVLRFLFNRGQRGCWHKVQECVKSFTQSNFTKDDLGRIKYVFPSAFRYSLGKIEFVENGRMIKDDNHLLIESNFDANDESICVINGQKQIDCGFSSRRLKEFHLNLINILNGHHQIFLSEKYPNLLIDESKLMKWHSGFDINNVPEIPISSLPAPSKNDKITSARSILEQIKSRQDEMLEKKLKKFQNKKEVKKQVEDAIIEKPPEEKPEPKPVPKKYKNIPASLLEKVRKKEQASELRKMMLTDEDEKKIYQFQHIIQLAKSLRTFYVFQRKTSLQMDFLAKKLSSTSETVKNAIEMDSLIRLLVKHSQDWLQIKSVREVDYVKIDMKRPPAQIIAHLEKEKKSFENAL